MDNLWIIHGYGWWFFAYLSGKQEFVDDDDNGKKCSKPPTRYGLLMYSIYLGSPLDPQTHFDHLDLNNHWTMDELDGRDSQKKLHEFLPGTLRPPWSAFSI